jgi:hypothetical protein
MLIIPELTNVLPLPPLIVTTLAVPVTLIAPELAANCDMASVPPLLASSVPELLKNPDVVPAPTVMVPPETSALIVPPFNRLASELPSPIMPLAPWMVMPGSMINVAAPLVSLT